jgi:hypothetical protein
MTAADLVWLDRPDGMEPACQGGKLARLAWTAMAVPAGSAAVRRHRPLAGWPSRRAWPPQCPAAAVSRRRGVPLAAHAPTVTLPLRRTAWPEIPAVVPGLAEV